MERTKEKTMEKETTLNERINVRINAANTIKVRRIIIRAKDYEGNRKYDDESHFIRCAIQKLINEHKHLLFDARGRPLKQRRDIP